jgi:hypothetical protein
VLVLHHNQLQFMWKWFLLHFILFWYIKLPALGMLLYMQVSFYQHLNLFEIFRLWSNMSQYRINILMFKKINDYLFSSYSKMHRGINISAEIISNTPYPQIHNIRGHFGYCICESHHNSHLVDRFRIASLHRCLRLQPGD